MNLEELPSWRPFLKRIPLFRDLGDADLDRLAEKLQPLSLPRGAVLFKQGDAGDAFYVVTSGQVQLISERDGRKTVVAHVGRGDAIGEMSLLSGEPRSLTGLLETTAEFLVLSKKDFASLVRENPSLLLQISRNLSTRLFQESRPRESAKLLQPQVLALVAALPPADRALLAAHLSAGLVEQTRRRVLLVDLHREGGALAKAFGLKPEPVDEKSLTEGDLRDPDLLSRLAQVHASGLGVLTLDPSALAGRLYRSIFLLVNLLRDAGDFVIVCLDDSFGDVERAVLAEADRWMLAGSAAGRPAFDRAAAALAAFVPETRRLLQVWLGDDPPRELTLDPAREWARLPWPEELAARQRAGAPPFAAIDGFPATRAACERLARRLGGLRVGVAMGTGAALGFSLIGVLKAFKRENIPIDLVAGTSIGSIIGGFHALGMEPEEIERVAVGVDKAWVYENLFWDMTLPRAGLFAGTTLLRFIRSYFGDKEFRDLALPFACVATDIETGEPVVFREGRVAEAVRASCGIPLVYQPFRHEGRFLVDGGLVDPVPIRPARELGADIVVAVNLTMPAGQRKGSLGQRRRASAPLGVIKDLALPDALKAPNLFQTFFQMIYTMEYEIAKTRDELADVTIHPDLTDFSWTELHRAKEIVEAGERVADTVLGKVKSLLPFFADHCRVDLRRR